METKELYNYIIDILDITEFKHYYYDNQNAFSGTAKNSFLKALDIPPKFFKEQPEETQDELLDNREVFVAENKKYFNKVIVVLKTKFGDVLNACRLERTNASLMLDKLKVIEDVPNKFEHRSFVKEGYTTIVISNKEMDKKKPNKVLVVDFPILLNKKPIIHEAYYTIPDDTFVTPVEHVQYVSNNEIKLTGDEADFNNIKDAIDSYLDFLDSPFEEKEDTPILRELEIVSIALIESGYIPKSSRDKVENYLKDNIKGELSTLLLEKLVLDFDETFTNYKQVTALRNINGKEILNVLNSDEFIKFLNEMELED